jgi:hypothetical protein
VCGWCCRRRARARKRTGNLYISYEYSTSLTTCSTISPFSISLPSSEPSSPSSRTGQVRTFIMSVSSSPPHTLAPTQSAFTHVSEHLHIIALSTVFFFAIDVLSAPFGRALFPKQFAGFSKKTERVWRSRAVGECLRVSLLVRAMLSKERLQGELIPMLNASRSSRSRGPLHPALHLDLQLPYAQERQGLWVRSYSGESDRVQLWVSSQRFPLLCRGLGRSRNVARERE